MVHSHVKEFLIELKMKGSSIHTVKNYNFHLNKFIKYVEKGELDYATLTTKQIKRFRNQMVEDNLKPKSINAILSALKSFYDFLVEEGEVQGNPIITRRLRVKEGQSLPDFMSVEELEIFTGWLKGVPGHVSLAFRTMLATGLRVSETASLTFRDMMALENGGYVLRVRHGKGNKERFAQVMDADVARELVSLKGDCRDELPLFGLSDHGYKWWARKCRLDTGLNFHTHRCRHTVGTQLLQRGVPIDKVQDVLGHADISTTRRYAKTAPEAILELAAKVDKIKEERAVYRYYL
jgi:site-specific recombinase XerD